MEVTRLHCRGLSRGSQVLGRDNADLLGHCDTPRLDEAQGEPIVDRNMKPRTEPEALTRETTVVNSILRAEE